MSQGKPQFNDSLMELILLDSDVQTVSILRKLNTCTIKAIMHRIYMCIMSIINNLITYYISAMLSSVKRSIKAMLGLGLLRRGESLLGGRGGGCKDAVFSIGESWEQNPRLALNRRLALRTLLVSDKRSQLPLSSRSLPPENIQLSLSGVSVSGLISNPFSLTMPILVLLFLLCCTEARACWDQHSSLLNADLRLSLPSDMVQNSPWGVAVVSLCSERSASVELALMCSSSNGARSGARNNFFGVGSSVVPLLQECVGVRSYDNLLSFFIVSGVACVDDDSRCSPSGVKVLL